LASFRSASLASSTAHSSSSLGLRRAAIGLLSILLAREADNFPHMTDLLIDAAVSAYGSALTLSSDARTQLDEFLRARLRGILIEEDGHDAQAVDVALAVGASNPGDARARARWRWSRRTCVRSSVADGPKVNHAPINRADLHQRDQNEKARREKFASGLIFREREKGLEPSTSTLARPGTRRNIAGFIVILESHKRWHSSGDGSRS
jgi:glycyl-tRNA synthetase beta subunit